MKTTHKIPVYFVPGLAASSKIFEHIILPNNYEVHFLEWLPPLDSQETLDAYVKRMANMVEKNDAILIGVSFGGVIVQEMKKLVNPKKVIIISSIKCRAEMPLRMHIAQKTYLHKLIPNITPAGIEKYEKYAFLDSIKKRIHLYKKYFSVDDKKYIPWAVHTIVNWQRTEPDTEIIHIHGTHDGVFPVQNIQNFTPISDGTHVMILNKAKKINSILADILPYEN